MRQPDEEQVMTEESAMSTGAVLHPSHRWGRRPIFERDAPGSNRLRERKIPCCLNCLVDGYEDEWDAFQPCRRAASLSPHGATPETRGGGDRG